MSDRAEGAIADAGETVQRGLNQVADTKDQAARFIRDRPIFAALIALGIGYLLGKIIWVIVRANAADRLLAAVYSAERKRHRATLKDLWRTEAGGGGEKM
jgi:hypothetical protein